MGLIKQIEGKGKRFLIWAITRAVRTRSVGADEMFATKPRRILVIRQHNQMGDMLLATPAFRAIKEKYPDSRLGVVSAVINRGVLHNNPHVDEVYTYTNRRPLTVLRMIRDLRRARFDIVIVLHTVSFSFTSAWLSWASGARYRVGSTSRPFGNSLSSAFYHMELPLPTPQELAKMSESEHNLYPLRALAITTEDLSPVLVPSHESEAWADRFVGENTSGAGVTLAVHPGAGKTENVWPPARFADVVNRIAAKTRLNLWVVEGPRDAAPVREFERHARVRCVVIRGRPIGDIAALLQRADLVLCNDTGIMHVAAAAGARTLAVFGPTDPVRWAPRCRSLRVVRGVNGDLSSVAPEDVHTEALRALGLVDLAERNLER